MPQTQRGQPLPPGSQTPRDRPPVPLVGTGVLSGRVVDAVTGRAIARARVRLQGPTPRAATLSDDSGTFTFSELPQGMYAVMADKSTYLPGRHPDAGRSLRNRNQMVPLAAAEVRDDLIVSMYRGGVIAGRVVDAHGDPIEGAMVAVMVAPKSGRPTMRNTTQTNDLGEFRATRLAAGRYILRIRPPNTGQFDPAPNAQPLPQPLPTYYPAAPSLDQAQPIVVNRGETVGGVDIVLSDGLPSAVSGIVIGVDRPLTSGTPGGGIAGSVSARAAGSLEGWTETGTGIRPDGTFRMQLPQGDYVLEARVSPLRAGNQPPGPDSELVGSARISVGDSPVENVAIALGAGAAATGRVIFEGAMPPPASPGQARVPIYGPPEGGGNCRPPTATINADWSFKVEGLVGTCALPPGSMMGRWTVKSVTFRDKNLAEESITFEPGQQYSNVQIVVTDRRSQVELRVADETGQPTRDFVALVFPANKEKWSQISRYMRTVVPPPVMSFAGATAPPAGGVNVRGGVQGGVVQGGFGVVDGSAMVQGNVTMQGGFVTSQGGGAASAMSGATRLPGLPPGDYYAIALDDIDPEDSQDPDVLERLAANAVRFTVSYDAPVEVPVRRWKIAEIIR